MKKRNDELGIKAKAKKKSEPKPQSGYDDDFTDLNDDLSSL